MGCAMVKDEVEGTGICRRALSPRERDVVQLVIRGLSNKQVARKLQLSEGTVKLHLHSVFQKLGAKNRYSLILTNLPTASGGAALHNIDLESPESEI